MVTYQTSDLLHWIPLLPLAAALLSGAWLMLSERRLPRWVVVGVACGAPIGSFLLASWLFRDLALLDSH